MPRQTSNCTVVPFVPNQNSFQLPSVKEIAAMSGQLSFLASTAYIFGMNKVAVGCEIANEELSQWWAKNVRNLGCAEGSYENGGTVENFRAFNKQGDV